MKNITVKQLADLAMEVETGDPIDWGMLAIREEDAYWLMSSQMLEMFDNLDDNDDKYLTALAVATKLVVENMVLNNRLIEMVNNK